MAGQLTLFKPWGADYARHTTAPRTQNAIYTSDVISTILILKHSLLAQARKIMKFVVKIQVHKGRKTPSGSI